MEKCTHITFTPIFKVNGYQVILGTKGELEDYIITGGNPWLVVDASGSPSMLAPTAIKVNGDSKLSQVLTHAKFEYQSMQIDWPDRGVPTMSARFWDAFYEYLSNELKGDLFIHCFGGHGRTGTIAAILAHYAGVCGKINPIEYIRKNYCEAAVESSSQIWYVETITGVSCDASYKSAPTFSNPITNEYRGESSMYNNAGYPVVTTSGVLPVAPSTERANNSIVMEIDRSMYDDLNWDNQSNGYLDSEGVFIGMSLSSAVSTLKARKAKAVKE